MPSRPVASNVLADVLPSPLSDERVLVAHIRRGDEAAFEALFRATYDELCAFADRYVTAPDIAEELVEDVFFRLWERRAAWQLPENGVRSYLFAAVRNQALNSVRHTRLENRRHAEMARDNVDAHVMSPQDGLESADRSAALREAVATLSPDRQRVLALKWSEGKSYAEIAHEVGSTVRAVEVQLARTLKALRSQLG